MHFAVSCQGRILDNSGARACAQAGSPLARLQCTPTGFSLTSSGTAPAGFACKGYGVVPSSSSSIWCKGEPGLIIYRLCATESKKKCQSAALQRRIAVRLSVPGLRATLRARREREQPPIEMNDYYGQGPSVVLVDSIFAALAAALNYAVAGCTV